MGSGNLSRHMKIHVNPSLKDSKQLCKDIKSIKDETSMEKPKDPHSDKLDQSALEKTLVLDNNKYTKQVLLLQK